MTNAEKHVAALVAAFGEPPFDLPNFAVTVWALEAQDNTVVASVEVEPGHIETWRVPNPEVLVPDPAGVVVKTYEQVDDDGNPVTLEVRFREDPITVATAELNSFLRVVR